MIRALATLALVFAQALPWAGGPWFVCIEGNGTVCVDGGPQNCDCRAASSACHDEPLAATGIHNGSVHRGAELDAAPCDCEHQLWEAAPTTLAGRLTAAPTDHTASAVFALPAAATPLATAQYTAADALVGPSAGAAERLLACVVLRC